MIWLIITGEKGKLILAKVFIVEDNQEIIEMVKPALAKWKYKTETVRDWDQVASEVTGAAPDLILVDITLPTFDGFYWIHEIRRNCQAPIIVISAANIDVNITRAIALGADDYLMKPFSTTVLLAKIQALLRRQQNNDPDKLSWDDNQLNGLTNELTNSVGSVTLSPTEGALLAVLISHLNHTVRKEQLLEWLWQGVKYLNENTLNVNISRLRVKLSTVKLAQDLRTERGIGYRLVANNED